MNYFGIRRHSCIAVNFKGDNIDEGKRLNINNFNSLLLLYFQTFGGQFALFADLCTSCISKPCSCHGLDMDPDAKSHLSGMTFHLRSPGKIFALDLSQCFELYNLTTIDRPYVYLLDDYWYFL